MGEEEDFCGVIGEFEFLELCLLCEGVEVCVE